MNPTTKISYNDDNKPIAIYITIKEEPIYDTIILYEGKIYGDLGKNGEFVGIEILL